MKKKILTLILSLLTSFSFGQNWNEIIKAVAADRGAADEFGHSVAISGDYAIVGTRFEDQDASGADSLTNAGSAYIFKNNAGTWTQVQKIVAADRGANDQFGYSVAISGDYAIVGAYGEDEDTLGVNTLYWAGAAYIFKNNAGTWSQVQKIVAADRGASDYFGTSVAISGDYAIVGAYVEDEDASGANPLPEAGSAYIFKNNAGTWSQVQKIVAADRGLDDWFGYSVAISGDYAIVGAYGDYQDASGANPLSYAGSAYIFKNNVGTWSQVQKIVASDRGRGDRFSRSVAISGDYAIVGAYWEDQDASGVDSLNDAGSAYIFKNNAGTWSQVQKIVAADRGLDDWFGSSVAISGDYAIVGAYWEDQDASGVDSLNNAGSAYIFKNNAGTWTQVQKIVASDRGVSDLFGNSVAISGDYAIVGAIYEDEDASGANMLSAAGAAYFFTSAIYGATYQDFNQNCSRDALDVGLANRILMLNPGNIILQTGNSGTWHLDSLAIGTYTITVDTSSPNWQLTCPVTQNFTVVHPDSFTVAPSFGFISGTPCPAPNITIHAPVLRPGFSNQRVYITACNEYTATGILDSAYVIITLDPLLSIQSGSLPFTSLGNNQYRVNIGDLYPGQCVDFWLDCTLSTQAILGQTLCMSAEIFPVDACVLDSIPNPYQGGGVSPCNTPWDNSSLSVEGQCLGDTVRFVIHNNGAPITGDMTCFAPIRLFIDGQFVIMDSIQLAGGDSIVFNFLGDGRTWRLEADQHPLHPGNSHPNATVERCGNHQNWTPGWYNVLPPDDADPVIDIFCGEVRGSYDPNDKTGYPYGLDSAHNIAQNQDIEYVVRFQNTGTDTAFTVVVRDTLPLELDIFSVRSGASSHDYNFRMYGPRILEWTFNYIMLPDSNVNEPLSHGFIKFKVKQNRDLPIGTVINNSAAIYFDFNAPVITNTYFHTVDTPSYFYALPFRDTIATTLCSNEPYNGYTYAASGQYFQATNTNGIDSLHILDLTILNTSDSTLYASDCSSYTLNGQTYTSTGTYIQRLKNTIGCDSILTLMLSINSNSYTLNQIACDSFVMNSQTYYNTGTYQQIITNSFGCDSTITLNLTVVHPTTATLSDSVCDNYTLNGQTYSSSGTYTQILTNAVGCDSTLTLNLIVENSTAETLSDSACLDYELNGQNYSISGTYTQVLTNGVGCDSILTLNLNILMDSSVVQNGYILAANQPNATYQWLDCATSSPIAGATDQTFIPTANGNYAVQITNAACIATSACYNVTNVGVEQVQALNNIRIYPNPTKNSFTIDFGAVVDANIQVFTIAGSSKDAIHRVSTADKTNIDLSDYPAGLYMVVVTVQGQAPQAFKVSKM